MKPVPKPPPPVGQQPRPGFSHPRFPTVGPTEPSNEYSSIIKVGDPYGPSVRNTIKSVKVPQPQVLQNSGDRSRAAYARGGADTTRNALDSAYDQYRMGYESQAQEAQQQDVLGQKQNAHDWLRALSQFDIYGADTNLRHFMDTSNIQKRGQRARSEAIARQTAAWMSLLSRLL